MKLFFTIIRWLIALFASVVWYVVVVTVIPTFIFVGNFATRDGATQFVQALTASDESTIAFRDGVFEGLAKGETTDASLRELSLQLANPTSPVGSAARKILTPKMIRENLKTNVTRIFDWVEQKTPELSLLFKLDGTKAEHTAIINAFFQSQYNALPECTEAEKAQFFNATSTENMPNCKALPYDDVTSPELAAGILSAPEYQQAVGTGYVMKFSATESDRQGIVALQKLSQTGMIILWIVISVTGLFIWFLFTPRAISSLVTGLLFLVTAFTLYSEIAIIKSITGDTLLVVTSNLSQAGNVLAIAGAGLFLLGIVLIVTKKSKTPTPAVQTAPVTPVVAAVVPEAAPAIVSPVVASETKNAEVKPIEEPVRKVEDESKNKAEVKATENKKESKS